MKIYEAGQCDIAVIGAGHAGIEAALAAARMGCSVCCFAINLDSVGNMPCNPAIRRHGQGAPGARAGRHGGEMAHAADLSCIQYRTLNLGKGPAVYSLRAQADRRRYQAVMKLALESQEGLRLIQGEIVTWNCGRTARWRAVVTRNGARWRCRAAIVCTGTYLRGRTFTGEAEADSGPDGLAASIPLAGRLAEMGLSLRRFKTGTPAARERPAAWTSRAWSCRRATPSRRASPTPPRTRP